MASNLKPEKAAGPDCFRPVVLKEMRNELVDIVQIIFQKSVSIGTIPAVWTNATVCPLFKKGVTRQTIVLFH